MSAVHYSFSLSNDALQQTVTFQHYPMQLVFRLVLMHFIPQEIRQCPQITQIP